MVGDQIYFIVGKEVLSIPAAALGPITTANNVVGKTEYSGFFMNFTYDPFNLQLMVSHPTDEIVTLFTFECVQYYHWVLLPASNK